MANRLSDDELRQSLLAFGENVGPITPGTRSVFERRLAILKKSKGPSLNALSSDDSEVENSSPSPRRKRTHRFEPDTRPTEVFKKPISVSIPVPRLYNRTPSNKVTTKGKKTTKNTSFDVETSDSDFDSDASTPGRSSIRSRKKILTADVPSFRRRESYVGEEVPFLQTSQNSSWKSGSDGSPLFSPTLERLKRDAQEPLNYQPQSNGYLPSANGGEAFGAKGKSTNHSHCVSRLLVFGAISFFVIVGALYISEVQKNNQHANKENPICQENMTEDECSFFVVICRELHNLLSKVAGNFECGYRGNRSLTVLEAKTALKALISADGTFEMENFDILFGKSIGFFEADERWQIRLSSNETLEAHVGSKSFLCRVLFSIQWTATRIIILFGTLVAGLSCWFGIRLWKKWREAQEALFYETVEKVIDLLQEPAEGGESCRAVVNIRDALIPANERKKKQRLWKSIVAFVEESESRVSVEYRKINGEDFKMWRWHASGGENESGKHGKVWQGQAFGNANKGKSTVYSPCLKIRNMFDPASEYGDSWQVNIHDAILEKCEKNDGIRHIATETTNDEGCVYMLCDSTESAGKAYNDLHGWWFDGKLVTVKYITQKRYLERFPDAASCHTPLRPSNNKRLSLSTPFFSSALERS